MLFETTYLINHVISSIVKLLVPESLGGNTNEEASSTIIQGVFLCGKANQADNNLG